MSKARLLAAFAYVALLGLPAVTLAQTEIQSARPLPLDPSVSAERKLYAKLHIAERFGITFRPYASICRDNRRNAARCFAKVITDDSGVPLSFDPAKQQLPGYSPKELRAAYGVSGVATGVTPIIAIVDAYADPSAIDDLKVYSKQVNLPVLPKCKGDVADSAVPCIQIVNEKGGNKLPTTVGWTDEQSIDLDMTHALCENCSILLVEADTNGDGDMFPSINTAAKLGANVISNSWGNAETDGGTETGTDHSYLTHPGVVMTFASGDDGYAGGVLYPASSPNVVAVGGTSLFLNKNGKKYESEAAWVGAGSGCSAYEARPSWQPSLPGCANNRTVSDISVDADPNTGVAVYNSNGCTGSACWYEFGGTSIGAPIVAAMFATAGNIPENETQAASLLYENVSKKNSRDIVTGSNGTCEIAYLCNAVAGYDGPTGLGSPKGLGIFNAQP